MPTDAPPPSEPAPVEEQPRAPERPPVLSIVIPTLNAAAGLARTLDGLKGGGIDYEVVIADGTDYQQTAVELVSADTQRAYVTGLPNPLRLVTLGAGMVDVGETVTPVIMEEANISQPLTGQDSVHAPVD